MRRIRLAAATVIAAVAVTVIVVPAASAGVHKYDTKVTIYEDANFRLVHGDVKSQVRKCERQRRVVLFRREPGADRKLGASRSSHSGNPGYVWGVGLRPAQVHRGGRIYAEVKRTVLKDGDVCRAARSRTLQLPRN